MDDHTGSTADLAIGRLYTTTEVAKALRVSQRVVQVWSNRGVLRSIKVGRLTRITQRDLDAFVDAGLTRPTAAAAATPAGP